MQLVYYTDNRDYPDATQAQKGLAQRVGQVSAQRLFLTTNLKSNMANKGIEAASHDPLIRLIAADKTLLWLRVARERSDTKQTLARTLKADQCTSRCVASGSRLADKAGLCGSVSCCLVLLPDG
ncbi:hypothetical protein J6590_005217 [Homalodisca vitripennis]|nr:hypothetical protein J6590_005217 [Homalodisca vitripennis]